MKRFLGFTLILVLNLMVLGGLNAQEGRKDPFKARFNDDIIRVTPGETFEFSVEFKVPPNHYLYDDKTTLLFSQKGDIEQVRSVRPDPEDHYDPFFKRHLKVHFHDFTQTFSFKVPPNAQPGRRTLEAEVRYQGCSDEFCYRPVKKTILLPVDVVPQNAQIQQVPTEGGRAKPPTPEASAPENPGFWELIRESNPDRLLNQGKVYLLGLALVGGILTSFTPCVLPIIPLTLAFIGVRRRRKGNLARAFMLVVGMVTMYSLLGFLVASLGLKLGFLFQSRYFVLATALFFLVFALGLFGVIPFHLPAKWQHKFARMGGEGPVGAFAAGLTIGLIASPCVGPLIAPLLLIAARSQDRLYGFLLLLNYGVGMGLIFLLLATGWAELQTKIRSGRWTEFLKKGMALLLLAPALYYGYAFAKPYLKAPTENFWVHRFEQGLALAQETQKPVLLDFYANWCPPCIELDKRTFSEPEVQSMAEKFVMIKVDCSFDDDNCQQATSRYEVVGWPTILFLHPDGQIIPRVNLIGGFADKDQMLQLMNQALQKARDGPNTSAAETEGPTRASPP